MSVWFSLLFGAVGYILPNPIFFINLIIFTNDRLFMALVGPVGSGKIRLICSMLDSPTTFYPPIEKTFYFYKEYQPLFQELSER